MQLGLVGIDEATIAQLRGDATVGALRDTYGADLVQLVHDLEVSCSIGWVDIDWLASSDAPLQPLCRSIRAMLA